MLYKSCYKIKIIPPTPPLLPLVATDNNNNNNNNVAAAHVVQLLLIMLLMLLLLCHFKSFQVPCFEFFFCFFNIKLEKINSELDKLSNFIKVTLLC